VTITTAEELRLIEEENRSQGQESVQRIAAFDEFDHIRAHGMGVKLGEPA